MLLLLVLPGVYPTGAVLLRGKVKPVPEVVEVGMLCALVVYVCVVVVYVGGGGGVGATMSQLYTVGRRRQYLPVTLISC